MNKWYRKTVTKAVLVVAGIISGAVLMTSLLGALTIAGTANLAEVWKLAGRPFEESDDFNTMVQGMMGQVMERLRLERMFETDGSYNPDKLVDVVEYTKSGSIAGENVSGVAYTLEELENWSEDYNNGEGDIYDSNSVTGNHSYQGHETEAGQDYAVTIRNLGETSLRGRILITAYYW